MSSVSPLGPASTLTDLASNLTNARAGGIESNGAGLIFYADRSAGQILAVDQTKNIYVVVLPFSGLINPQAISLDVLGNFLYIADVGNRRIVRVNLSLPLPAKRVQVVVDSSAGVTDLVADLKYNPSDGYLYWSNDGTLHRAAVKGQPIPVESGETLITKNSIEVRYFDFDFGAPQNIFFSSGSGGFKGIYSSRVPRVGDTPNLDEVSILNNSATPDVTVVGVAIDKNGPFLCYSAVNTPAPVLRCGDRTTTAVVNFPDILSAEFTTPPNFMVIESPSTVVSPATKLSAPVLQLNLAIRKPEVVILLKEFELAVLRTAERLVARATGGKIEFRYVVVINKKQNADGAAVSMAKHEARRKVSMRNVGTAQNLRPDSTYEVSYNIEITQAKKGEPTKVVRTTKLSPVSRFVVPAE